MNEHWQQLIDALRTEVREYGGLLHLFECQYRCIMRNAPDEFLAFNGVVNDQIEKVGEVRVIRERLVRNYAIAEGLPEEATLSSMLESGPAALRPLVRALIEEINSLLARTQKRIRQNRILVGHMVEASREIVRAIDPEAITETYSNDGTVKTEFNVAAGHYLPS